MGEVISGDIKELLSIKNKPRLDSTLDHYSRIYMVKGLLACTIIVTIAEYLESVNCIIPESLDLCNGEDDGCSFPQSTCWIQGMYVYKELMDKVENNIAYYGIPKNIDHDGFTEGTDELCVTEPRLGERPSKSCIPMEKTFYLQYQWMAFVIGALSLLYYLPYVVFRNVNSDLFALERRLKPKQDDDDDDDDEGEADSTKEIPEPDKHQVAEAVLRDFFRSRDRTRFWRPFLNVIVKVLYICVNVISLLFLDHLLNREYLTYGKRWIEWANLGNTMMYDYMGLRNFPKPGNRLLPPFGYCELYESARDIRHTRANKHKLVCEMSQHVLWQYCLLLIWFGIVIGIGISFLAFLDCLWRYLVRYTVHSKLAYPKSVTKRQIDYLEYMKETDNGVYEEVLKKLHN